MDKFKEKKNRFKKLEGKQKIIGFITGISVLIVILFLITNLGTDMVFSDYGTQENISIETDDGWTISGTHYTGGEEMVVLIHMLGGDSSDWDNMVEELLEERYTVVTLDLRGHGESQEREGDETTDWRNFEDDFGEEESWDTEFKKMREDVRDVVDYVKESSEISKVNLVGAEIGANIAAHYTEIREVDNILMISPGLGASYWSGVPIIGQVQNFENPTLFVVSEDTAYSLSGTELLYNDSPSEDKEKIVLEEAGRGTRIFEEEPELVEDLVEWINQRN